MPDYVVTMDGVLQTANGRSRVKPGTTVSLTEHEHRANAQLFVEQPAPEPVGYVADDALVYTIIPEGKPVEVGTPIAEIMKPVRHTPKAEPKKPVLRTPVAPIDIKRR